MRSALRKVALSSLGRGASAKALEEGRPAMGTKMVSAPVTERTTLRYSQKITLLGYVTPQIRGTNWSPATGSPAYVKHNAPL